MVSSKSVENSVSNKVTGLGVEGGSQWIPDTYAAPGVLGEKACKGHQSIIWVRLPSVFQELSDSKQMGCYSLPDNILTLGLEELSLSWEVKGQTV